MEEKVTSQQLGQHGQMPWGRDTLGVFEREKSRTTEG